MVGTRVVKMSSSFSGFQQARLAEQLRLSSSNLNGNNDSITTSTQESSSSAAAGAAPATNGATTSPSKSTSAPTSTSSDAASVEEQSRNVLEMENEALGPDGMPFAPMMTYQKYLTMQEKRVKVAIRYSASAGLRPFYLTVANRIKSTYPDVLLEKRILPPVGSDAGGDEAIFEVVVDGKTVIGKKKTKLLKVTSRGTSRKTVGQTDHDVVDAKSGDGVGGGGAKKNEKGNNHSDGDSGAPDIAGGRAVFVSMEKLDHELTKARKRRRPNTMYRSKEIVSGGVVGAGGGRMMIGGGEDGYYSGMVAGGSEAGGQGSFLRGGSGSGNNFGDGSGSKMAGSSPGMAEAVIRLERLKAMSTRNKI